MTLYNEVRMEGLFSYVDSMPVEHRQHILGVLNGEVRIEAAMRLAQEQEAATELRRAEAP